MSKVFLVFELPESANSAEVAAAFLRPTPALFTISGPVAAAGVIERVALDSGDGEIVLKAKLDALRVAEPGQRLPEGEGKLIDDPRDPRP
jgi:hypothetical protein